MTKVRVRTLGPENFETTRAPEQPLFGASGEGVLAPYYVHLCGSFLGRTPFLADAAGRAVGHLVAFVEGPDLSDGLALLPGAKERT